MPTVNHHNIAVEILGKSYKVRCPQDKVQELQNAAGYVDKEMRKLRDTGNIVGLDRIAVVAALNIAYELLTSERKENTDIDVMSVKIREMQKKVESVLTQKEQLRLVDKAEA